MLSEKQRCEKAITLELCCLDEKGNLIELPHPTVIFTLVDSPFEMVIGREDIKRWELVNQFPSHFLGDDGEEVGQDPNRTGLVGTTQKWSRETGSWSRVDKHRGGRNFLCTTKFLESISTP